MHLLVEKPLCVHKADCELLIAAHRSSKQVFATMFVGLPIDADAYRRLLEERIAASTVRKKVANLAIDQEDDFRKSFKL